MDGTGERQSRVSGVRRSWCARSSLCEHKHCKSARKGDGSTYKSSSVCSLTISLSVYPTITDESDAALLLYVMVTKEQKGEIEKSENVLEVHTG